jgi:hypothetical protein
MTTRTQDMGQNDPPGTACLVDQNEPRGMPYRVDQNEPRRVAGAIQGAWA